MKKIGFIGLGNMGGPMAANLVKADFEVRGFDVVPEALEAARASGVSICATAAETVIGADIVITMLPSGKHTLKVYSEVLDAASEETIFIDSSTIDVKSSRDAHGMAASKGMKSLDAPVSGGVGGAAAGTLTFMIGGEADVFAASQPVFDVMGAKSVHCGDAGAGQAAKICNNMLLAISMIGTCEAFALAEKLGLDQKALFEVVSTSSGQCWSVNTYCPAPGVGPQTPADNNYEPGFAASLMLKDVMLSQQAAEQAGATTPLGQHAAEIYQSFVDEGNADKDFSGVILKLANG